jgi:hypothetical protein
MRFLTAITNFFARLFGPGVAERQLLATTAQNATLQLAFIEALRTAQELNKTQETSLDRVIISRFDRPSSPTPFGPSTPTVFPQSSLSDLLNVPDEDFVQLDVHEIQ